jgi:hypothetical protein
LLRAAADDVAELFRQGLKLAKQLLGEQPGFYPFGYVMGNSGKLSLLSGYTDKEHSEATEILRLIEGAIQMAARGGAKAALIGVDAHEVLNGGKRQDAIVLTAEHVDGEPLQMIVPYTRRWRRLSYGEPRTQSTHPKLLVV